MISGRRGTLLILMLVITVSANHFRDRLKKTGGVILLPRPGVMEDEKLELIDQWLLQHQNHVLYSVRQPEHRKHILLLPSDAHGLVSEAVGSIAKHLGLDHPLHHYDLVELAAFLVFKGAQSQPLHRDTRERGHVSCQLALADVDVNQGGLMVWPNTLNAGSAPSGPRKRFLKPGRGLTQIELLTPTLESEVGTHSASAGNHHASKAEAQCSWRPSTGALWCVTMGGSITLGSRTTTLAEPGAPPTHA